MTSTWLRVLACVALLFAGCSGGSDTPEDRVRAVIIAIEAAAQARDVGAIKSHLSETYKDAQGHDRRAVLGIATGHFMRNKTVYILSRILEVDVPEPGFARVEIVVALAGTPINDLAALPGVRADLYRFDVRLREESDEWRVTSAAWQPATLSDFE